MSISTAIRLHGALVDAGIPILGVSIGKFGDKTTYRVSPTNLQEIAQDTIDIFDDTPTGDELYQKQLTIASIKQKLSDKADPLALMVESLHDTINVLRIELGKSPVDFTKVLAATEAKVDDVISKSSNRTY